MVGNSEGKNSPHKLSEAKSAIYESMNNLRKWRENQLQNFQKKQITEHQSLLEQSEMKRKSLEQYFESNQEGVFSILKTQLLDRTTDSTSGSENTLHESSVTGHFLRCFSDNSGDSHSSILQDGNNKSYFPNDKKNNSKNILEKENQIHKEEENLDLQEPVTVASKRQKKPFLKKGTGLLRYMPKQRRNPSNFSQSSESQNSLPEVPTKSVLKSSATTQMTLHATQQPNRVQFREPVAFVYDEKTPRPPFEHKSKLSVFENLGSNDEYKSSCYSSSNPDSEDGNHLSYTSLSSENQELAEFEMLENCAQNSSFNSDSSIVQRVLHGASIKAALPKCKQLLQNFSSVPLNKENSSVTVGSSKSMEINSLEDMEVRKQRLENLISDINPRIASLQLFTSNSNPLEHNQEVSDRCSTPIEHRSNSPSPSNSNDNSSKDTSMDSIIFVPTNQSVSNENAEPNNLLNEHQLIDEQKNSELESNTSPVDKQTLRSKMEELENEIKIYQETNARLSAIRQEREEVLKKLKKEKDEIQKYKEDEKKKLDLELESERKQLKRERETFNRYQKLRRDNPGRKEREEMSALRQEVEKLQEEIKRQKNKFNSDMKRLKNQLASAEKERDSLKLENITLEEQCQDLLTALRNIRKEESREKRKKSDDQTKLDLEKESQCKCSKEVETVEKSTSVDCDLLSSAYCDNETEGFTSKPKVRFNTNPKYDPSVQDIISFRSEMESKNSAPGNIEVENDDHEKQSNKEVLFEESKHGDQLERIYISGEKEVIYPSGTIRHTSADEKTAKILYPNGDIIEILPDNSKVLRYAVGVVSKLLPSGLKINEFPDGQIQQLHPDGLQEVRFPDGTTESLFPNGTREIHDNDGNVTRLYADGTEITEFTNGEKIIRTATLKRREWPDGSVKIIYNCGKQETRYADGRIKIKDKDGRPIVDTKYYKGLGDTS